MFEFQPIIWLQSFESPVMTGLMNGISLIGYTRAYIAITIVLAFWARMRPAVALLVILALNGALTDIAKAGTATPRPDWSQGQVRALSVFAKDLRARDADTPTQVEDSYGFPSGHVSATTAFAIGLAVLLGWGRKGWTLAIAWIVAMALSRMYLGRHFLGDVLGGVGVGLAVVGLGFGVLKLRHLARELRAHDPWPAHRVMTVAIVLAGGALLVGLPDAGDAGRLLGAAVGVLFLVHHDVFEFALSRRGRLLLVVTAGLSFGVAWYVMTLVLRQADDTSVSALRLAASALPNAAVLIGPALLPRRLMVGSLSPRYN